MKRRPARTVLEVCVERRGVHKGALAAANVVQHAIAQDALGHFPTGVEYSEYWSISDRSAWRHRARARAAFGDELETVVAQLASYIEQHDERSQRKLRLAAVRVSSPVV